MGYDEYLARSAEECRRVPENAEGAKDQSVGRRRQMSLKKSIKDGEGKTIEFKAELPNSTTLVKTIIAFSNTGGGKLIIGGNDQGKIIGLKPDENILELKDKVASIIYETCYPNENDNIISTKEASNILGISDRATRTVLTTMVEMNTLIRIDKGPQTHYKLVDKA